MNSAHFFPDISPLYHSPAALEFSLHVALKPLLKFRLCHTWDGIFAHTEKKSLEIFFFEKNVKKKLIANMCWLPCCWCKHDFFLLVLALRAAAVLPLPLGCWEKRKVSVKTNTAKWSYKAEVTSLFLVLFFQGLYNIDFTSSIILQ